MNTKIIFLNKKNKKNSQNKKRLKISKIQIKKINNILLNQKDLRKNMKKKNKK